jgi:UDP-3-O-[3-hydroxymyristoyl] glucosamine N-acyltransferase
MKRVLEELASALGLYLIGDGHAEVKRVASVQSAQAGDLVFAEDARNFPQALASNATAVIAGEFAANQSYAKPVLIAVQPRLAFARAAVWLCRDQRPATGIHPSAVLHPAAKLAKNVNVEERAVIGADVQIAEGTTIGSGCVIGSEVTIGKDCRLYPNVTVYPGVLLGERVVVHAGAVLGSDGFGYVRDSKTGHYEKFPQMGRLEIEADVEIGANATVDRGALDITRIRRGSKIDNLVHVGHNVDVGEDVVIAAQTGVSGSSIIENGVIVGGQVGIADHVRIEQGAILGAQSGIPSRKTIRGKGIVFWGTPARPIKQYLKELAILARLAKRDAD